MWRLRHLRVALLFFAPVVAFGETNPSWERLGAGLDDTAFLAVAVDPASPEWVAAACRQRVYTSTDGGRTWQMRFHVPRAASITGLAITAAPQPIMLVATDHGLYGSHDGGRRWSRPFRGAGQGSAQCTVVAFHPRTPGTAFLGTRNGLLVSVDHGRSWRAVRIPQAAREVVHISFDPRDPDRLYLLGVDGLFIGNPARGEWQRRVPIAQGQALDPDTTDETDALEDNETDELPAGAPRFSAVAPDPRNPFTVYLAGSRGLEMSADGGIHWQPVSRLGLESPSLSRFVLAAHSPLVIYAATRRGVARYDPTQGRWHLLTQGLFPTRVQDLAATKDHLWAATEQGLYRAELVPDPFSDSEPPSPRELLANFVHEPTITAVQEAAIRYAEVEPEKISRWRRQAALRALLPMVDVGLDRDRARRASIDEGTFPKFQIIETDTDDAGLDVSIKWELGDLLWNDDQTSIDVRSKLMVQLRNDVMDEVTRSYFERRRLQALLLTRPPPAEQEQLEQELRLQELTALLDGYTGGYFSQQIKIVQSGQGE